MNEQKVRPPDFEEIIDLVGTLDGLAGLVQPSPDGWRPEMHVERINSDTLKMWFGDDPCCVYRLSVRVEEDS